MKSYLKYGVSPYHASPCRYRVRSRSRGGIIQCHSSDNTNDQSSISGMHSASVGLHQNHFRPAVRGPSGLLMSPHSFDFGTRTLAQLPAWFKSNGYQSPTSATSGPLQHIFNTNLNTFEYWATLPTNVLQNFNTCMTGNRGSRPSWIGTYFRSPFFLSEAKS